MLLFALPMNPRGAASSLRRSCKPLYAEASPVPREVINMGRPFKCPCGASNSVGKGFRRTKTMGKRRIRLCKSCGQKFTPTKQKRIEEGEVLPPSVDQPI